MYYFGVLFFTKFFTNFTKIFVQFIIRTSNKINELNDIIKILFESIFSFVYLVYRYFICDSNSLHRIKFDARKRQ